MPTSPDTAAMHSDLVTEANQRRIRAINRKLEEEKARAAKQRAQARVRGSKADELDALAALERELLAEVSNAAGSGTAAATPTQIVATPSTATSVRCCCFNLFLRWR